MALFINEKLLIGDLLVEEDDDEIENSATQENLPAVFSSKSNLSCKNPHPADFVRGQEQYMSPLSINLAENASDFIPQSSQFLEMALDQQGSRYLQEKCHSGSSYEKTQIIKQSLEHSGVLMEDIFGNYVIQMALDEGGAWVRETLLLKTRGKIMSLSLHSFGCRVVQKFLDYPNTPGIPELLLELDCARCIEDSNANHVIQKCLKSLPGSMVEFIVQTVSKNTLYWASHCYGCRIVQELIDKQTLPQLKCQLISLAPTLSKLEFGNYVVQKLIACQPQNTIQYLLGDIEALSKDKYASNVVEKCLVYGNHKQIHRITVEVFASPKLLQLMTDKFANFVVQKIIEVAKERELDMLVGKVRAYEHILKKSTLGKYVLKALDKKLSN